MLRRGFGGHVSGSPGQGHSRAAVSIIVNEEFFIELLRSKHKAESRCGRRPTVVRITRSQDASTKDSFSGERASAGNVEVFRAILLVAHPSNPNASNAALAFFNRARRFIRLRRVSGSSSK